MDQEEWEEKLKHIERMELEARAEALRVRLRTVSRVRKMLRHCLGLSGCIGICEGFTGSGLGLLVMGTVCLVSALAYPVER